MIASPVPSAAGVRRYLVRALVFLALFAGIGGLLWPALLAAFHASPYLNGLILVLFVFGAGFALRCMAGLQHEAQALERIARLAAEARSGERRRAETDELLTSASLGALGVFLATVRRVLHAGDVAGTLPYLLDSLAARGEDRRALVRYLSAALVLIGLIGTFYGLLVTIEGVRGVLGGLAGGEGAAWLDALRERLSMPLSGMGTGFATSLFGLVCSAALGFLELQLFHAQNTVNSRLETLVVADLVPLWQAPAALASSGGELAPRYLAAIAEAVVERLDRVAGLLETAARRDDAGRIGTQLGQLEGRINALSQGVQDIERERTAELRHQLKVIAQYLGRGAGGDAP